MAEQDLDAQIAGAVAGDKEKDVGPKLCVWSQGKVFEFPAEAQAVVSADHQYLEIRLEVEEEFTGPDGIIAPVVVTKVLGGFLGLWGYKWR